MWLGLTLATLLASYLAFIIVRAVAEGKGSSAEFWAAIVVLVGLFVGVISVIRAVWRRFHS